MLAILKRGRRVFGNLNAPILAYVVKHHLFLMRAGLQRRLVIKKWKGQNTSTTKNLEIRGNVSLL